MGSVRLVTGGDQCGEWSSDSVVGRNNTVSLSRADSVTHNFPGTDGHKGEAGTTEGIAAEEDEDARSETDNDNEDVEWLVIMVVVIGSRESSVYVDGDNKDCA